MTMDAGCYAVRDGPHIRRRDLGSRFCAGETPRSGGRPGDDWSSCGFRVGTLVSFLLLDVVIGSAAVQCQAPRQPWRAARAQSRWRRSFFHGLGPISEGKRVERSTCCASYAYQLHASAVAVLRGEPVKTMPDDAVENMTVSMRSIALPVSRLRRTGEPI